MHHAIHKDSTTMFTMTFDNLDEVTVAAHALTAYRAKGTPGSPAPAMPPLPPQLSDPAQDQLADRIWHALNARPLNTGEAEVVAVFLETPDDKWLPYRELFATLAKRGLGSNEVVDGKPSEVDFKAARALGLLSARMRDFLPAGDYAGKPKPIEAFAARSKQADGIAYRLTKAGRKAAERLLKS
jgi:hypothetical protein